MKFHVITGLPRSGSTLLCNLLAQNPDFHASSTSPLAATVGGVANFWSTTPEIKSDLAHDKAGTQRRLVRTLRALVEGWYADHDEPVIFDKSRGWITMVDRLGQLYPEARLLCCVRDPRDVLASVQKQHLAFPVLDESPSMPIANRADQMFSPQGIVGGPLTHIEDQIAKKSKAVVPVVYEKLVDEPEKTLRHIYVELGIDWWDGHDFEDVKDTSTDLDALYMNKYPHDGSGRVEKPAGSWQDFVPAELGQMIVQRYPTFSKLFGYA